MHVKKLLYFSLIYPNITYCIETYCNTFSTYLAPLIIACNKILQGVPRRTANKELYVKFNTLPADLLFKYHILLFVYKCVNRAEIVPVVFHNSFAQNASIHSHNTRFSSDLHMYVSNDYYPPCSLKSIGIRLWNELNFDTKNSPTVTTFKSACLLEFITYL